MKCAACGYRYKEPDIETGENKLVSDGEDQFIKVINNFHYKDRHGNLEEAYLYICPKCGTARMDTWR